jgi:hypothetical protein
MVAMGVMAGCVILLWLVMADWVGRLLSIGIVGLGVRRLWIGWMDEG